jgi:hypothetical protein
MAANIVTFVHKAGASGMIDEKNDNTKVLTIVIKGTCGSGVTSGSASFSVVGVSCSSPSAAGGSSAGR